MVAGLPPPLVRYLGLELAARVRDLHTAGGEVLSHQDEELHHEVLEPEVGPVLLEAAKHRSLARLQLEVEKPGEVVELTVSRVSDGAGSFVQEDGERLSLTQSVHPGDEVDFVQVHTLEELTEVLSWSLDVWRSEQIRVTQLGEVGAPLIKCDDGVKHLNFRVVHGPQRFLR